MVSVFVIIADGGDICRLADYTDTFDGFSYCLGN